MKLYIGDHEFSEVWDGVYYKALADYPQVGDHELRDILDFISYEKSNGRKVEISADRPEILVDVLKKLEMSERYQNVPRPEVIRECKACTVRGGCMTDLICHTAPPENAVKILECGSLRSAVKARGIPAEDLMREPRNAAKDPADFFHYVMFSWGNCQAGDRLVMERLLGRSPRAEELGSGFTPGVRFYFKYDRLDRHPDAVHDGFLPIKVRDEVVLADYVYAIIIPSAYHDRFAPLIPAALTDRVYYLDHTGLDVWQWSEKVYSFVHALDDPG